MKAKRKRRNVAEIYDNLKEKMIALEYRPGEQLHVTELKKQLDASDEVIKDALERLAKSGFVILNKDGARVVTWEAEDIEEIQALSLTMDRLVLDEIFEQSDRSVLLKELGIIRDRFEKADSPQDSARWAEQFSKALYRSTGSRRLLHMASSIKAQQAMLRNMLIHNNLHPQSQEHEQIVAGIEQGSYEQTLRALESAYAKKTQAILELI